MTQPKHLKPPPPHFCENFIRGGWRKIERMYGSRTEVLRNWYHICGGERLTVMARAYRGGDLAVLDEAMAMDRARCAPPVLTGGPPPVEA